MSKMKNCVSGLVSGSTASTTIFSNTASSSLSSSSFTPVQLKVKNQTFDITGNRGTGGNSDGSVNNLSNSSAVENNLNSDSNRIFRNTINLIVDNNNPVFSSNVSSVKSSANESNAQKMTTSKINPNISKKVDLNESEELDNINITVNLFDANINFLNNKNNSLSYDNEIHLNNSIGSSVSSNSKNNEKLQQTYTSSDYENDSINSNKKNKVLIFYN